MGQLERYGLYVLVLVIFLILGVAMWGDVPVAKRTGEQNATVGLRGGELDGTTAISRALGGRFDVDELVEKPTGDPAGPVETPSSGAGENAGAGTGGAGTGGGAVAEPPVATARTYTIRAGDNLESIARRELGDRGVWRQIKELNPGLDERRMQVGTVITLPSAPATTATPVTGPKTKPASAVAGMSYRVRGGDSPARISKKFFGHERFADEIMAANGITDARRLLKGANITIPDLK